MRSRFLVRDIADIDRVRTYLLTHWTPPRVEFQVDMLPAVESQRAQDRIVRLAGGCNCLLGEALAMLTLVGGSFIAWISFFGRWQVLELAAVTALGAGLTGKGIELAWTRARMLLALRDLRYRLADVLAGRQPRNQVKVSDPVRTAFSSAVGKPLRATLNGADGDEARIDAIHRPRLADRPQRPIVFLSNATDINRMAFQLGTRWRLPRIEFRLDALPRVDVQRAQDSFARLSRNRSYLLAGVLATVALLGGLFRVVMMYSQDPHVTSPQSWRAAGLVGFIALYAALLGCVVEVLWIRVRLLLVLHGLRRRLR